MAVAGSGGLLRSCPCFPGCNLTATLPQPLTGGGDAPPIFVLPSDGIFVLPSGCCGTGDGGPDLSCGASHPMQTALPRSDARIPAPPSIRTRWLVDTTRRGVCCLPSGGVSPPTRRGEVLVQILQVCIGGR
ncbi:uncharacterized protein [Miscanthus floridulus]|uniref:uncharacterized protein n=1 Tax=Miscanthus floridulus TaxID=154761 RepID=UPI0034591FBA